MRRLIPKLHPLCPGKEFLRYGPDRDGGYLIPNDLEGISACFSPGVSNESGFEYDCAMAGMKVMLADASVDAPAANHDGFNFTPAHISGRRKEGFLCFEDWVKDAMAEDDGDLMLQMDIEGAEYEVLRHASAALLRRFRIMVIEFHHLQLLKPRMVRVFHKLLKSHHCVHLHPNNYSQIYQLRELEIPSVMEFTFYRKDRISEQVYRSDFPHSLDRDNVDASPLELPPIWFRGFM